MRTIMRYQPQGRVLINAGNVFGKNLAFAYIPSQEIDPVTGYRFNSTDTDVSFPASPTGILHKGGSAQTGSGVKVAPAGFSGIVPLTSNDYSIYARVFVSQQNVREFVFADFTSSGSTCSVSLEKTASNTWSANVRNGAGTQAMSGGTASNGWHDIIITVKNGQFTGFWNGRPENTITVSTGSNAGTDLRIGCAGGYKFLGWTGLIQHVFFFNRGFTADELLLVAANPWQLFLNSDDSYEDYGGAAGPQSYTFTMSGGIVFSGTGTLVKGKVNTPAGGIQFSGSAPTSKGQVRSANGGIVFGGTSTSPRGTVRTPSGGIVFGGNSGVVRAALRTPTGGLNMAGSASVIGSNASQSVTITMTGGLIISGTASLVKGMSRGVSGGYSFGGHATVTSQHAGVTVVVGAWNDVKWQKLELKGYAGTLNDKIVDNKYWRDLLGGSNKPLNDVKREVLGTGGSVHELEKKYWENL